MTGHILIHLPQSAVAQLGDIADSTQRYKLMGFDGSRSFASGVRVDMMFSSNSVSRG